MNEQTRIKYPRSVHMSTSPGYTPDDVRAQEDEWANFHGREIVVSSKLDGENTNLTREAIWARSVDGYNFGPAASTRDWMRAFYGRIQHELPEGMRFSGENVSALHSIYYPSLPSYFLLFAVWDENNMSLAWDQVEEWAELLGIYTVPVLYRGEFDLDVIKALDPVPTSYGEEQAEGFVVRIADSFAYDDFTNNLRKWVRAGHVAGEHWTAGETKYNGLADGATPWPGKLAR